MTHSFACDSMHPLSQSSKQRWIWLIHGELSAGEKQQAETERKPAKGEDEEQKPKLLV